jgi:trigger factor
MQIDVTELEPCKLSIHYEAGAEEIFNKRGEVLQHFKKAPVPGFRPGKATLDAVKVHYRSQIEESLKRALAEDAYHNTLFEKKIKPHGPPRMNNAFLGDGKFTCDFELYSKPNFTLTEFKGITIPKPHESMTDIELAERMIQELRVKSGEASPFTENEFIQHGDNVILNYDATIDGVRCEQLCGEGEMLTVGASQLAEFDDNLLGMTIGETREFDLVVASTGLPSMVGKTIHFTVNLIMGSKIVPAPLDDSLAIKVGKKDFFELKEYALGMAQAKVQEFFRGQLLDTVVHYLVDNNSVDVPNWMALSEAQYLVHNAKLNWATLPDQDKEKYLDLSVKNVKLALVLDKIRETEPEAQLSDQEVFNMIKNNIAQSKAAADFDATIKEMNRTGYLQILMSRIRDEYTLDFVIKSARIVE